MIKRQLDIIEEQGDMIINYMTKLISLFLLSIVSFIGIVVILFLFLVQLA